MPAAYSKEKSKTNITVFGGTNCDYADWRTEIVAASMYNNTFDAHENLQGGTRFVRGETADAHRHDLRGDRSELGASADSRRVQGTA